jgi:asparagine synthase (glutamine-hydrolysing)
MCGIAGCIVAPGRQPRRTALEEMAAALSHRGPDDHGVLVAGNVGLVNTRLAIVDPSPAGHQPMADPSGRWLLTYNGEIFNHEAIRKQLAVDGWRGGSDTETLVTALAAWDADALERCNGFFALAALDLARGRLLLARDRFGVKPLYMARWDGGLWFASEMRALIAGGVPARVRRDVLSYVVKVGWAAGRQTPIEAIERLPPGSLVAVDTGSLEMAERRWYEPADAVSGELAAELAGQGRAELGARLESALRGAVRRRLLGDVPVGTACSGGLDSTLVTALARDEDRSIVAFNASLVDEPRADEGRWAELAARRLDVELDTVRITAADWRAAFVAAVAHHEYPLSAGASSVSISLMARRARQRGIKVLLTGEAADELFGGYPLLHGEEYRRFLPAHLMLRRMIEEARGLNGISRIGRLLLALLRGKPGSAYTAVDPPADLAQWREAALRSAQQAYAHHPGARGRLETVLLSWMSAGTFSHLLNRMDKDPMSYSVETRIPFLDPQVVELAVNLPLEQRVAPSTKGLLRDVARLRLPGPIVRRPKQPGMLFKAERRIEEAARPAFLERGYLRDLLQLSIDGWRRMVDDLAGDGGTRLWTAEIWCRLFIEGQDVPSVERDLWVPESI